jgi:hypothetical protein
LLEAQLLDWVPLPATFAFTPQAAIPGLSALTGALTTAEPVEPDLLLLVCPVGAQVLA